MKVGKAKDITGQRFSRLTVAERVRHKGRMCWKCECDCGNITYRHRTELESGACKSCGCLKNDRCRSRLIDLTGKRYNRLVVLGREGTKGSKPLWRCLCDCGSITYALGSDMQSGRKKSCGCLKSEVTTERNYKHGDYGSPTYRSWHGMIQRCTDESASNYQYYGERGIAVCDRWLDYRNFLADMGERPKGRSIDRIDNNGNYEPGNCRWATASEQMKNRREFPIPDKGPDGRFIKKQ